MSNKPLIFLIGVADHGYQRDMPYYNDKCKAPLFEEYLKSEVDAIKPQILFEEEVCSNKYKSWVQKVAQASGIGHFLIEANESQREAYGIKGDDFSAREKFWQEEISKRSFDTAICVIGAKHIPTFQKNASTYFDFQILCTRYDPCNTNPL